MRTILIGLSNYAIDPGASISVPAHTPCKDKGRRALEMNCSGSGLLIHASLYAATFAYQVKTIFTFANAPTCIADKLHGACL